jgi:WS/DGAT/MGAT family acyltransferase
MPRSRVRRLSGESSGFRSLDIPGQPINNLLLAIVAPAAAGARRIAPLSRDDLLREVSRRLPLLPAFRWRVQPIPGGVGHPVFADDPEFGLERHLCEHTLADPGGLDRFVASLAEQHLDPRHPLWQLWLIHGLDADRQGVLLKIHHCVMDGFAAIATLECLFSDQGPDPVLPEFGAVGAAPRPARLVGGAVRTQGRALRRLPSLIGATRRGFAAGASDLARGAVRPPSGKDLAACGMTRAFTAERAFARASLPLAELKQIKRAAGATLNDVALAVVAGSFRAYLQARADLPARPLIASLPVSTDATRAVPRTFGNRFAAVTTSLATDVADPWERLRVIGATTAQAKRQLSLIGPDLLPDWLELVPPAVLDRGIRLHDGRRRRGRAAPSANLVVSNVRGPRPPCSFAGAPVQELFLVGPPNGGVAANVTLADLGDTLHFAILTYADAIDGPQEIGDGLHASLDELAQRANAVRA